ncbi:TetR/AcrR family transcriptional regulator [Ciceribacter ferrooxidans]|nr:TetR/AcrR family transcriptional regulator [Ciceribacter ferrooxidans]
MRVSKKAMAEHHQAIVSAAARLFREEGIGRTSVAEVMQAAGLTHGGFYRHFDSKEALVAEAVTAAFDEFVEWLASRKEKNGAGDAVATFSERYLSDAHFKRPGQGCPIPTFGIDLAREDQDARKPFAEGVERLVAALADGMRGNSRQRRAAAMRRLATLAGAIVIARAVDRELAAEVLAACRGPESEKV